MDTTTKVLQKIKTEATNFINQITQTLTQPHQDQQSTIIPTPQHSPYLDLLNIKSSDKPFNHRTEKKLMNDPGIKLKKAILFATNDQLQKTSQQTKQSLKKQAKDEYEL